MRRERGADPDRGVRRALPPARGARRRDHDRPLNTRVQDGARVTLSRADWIALGAVVGILLVFNLIWIGRDHGAPAWDQASYLDVAFQWRRAVDEGGFHRIVSAFFDTDPARAPLYVLVITPFVAGREGVDAALLANTLILGGTVLAAAVAAASLYGRRAALPAAVFVATCPIIYGLSRTPLVDILLAMFVALAVMSAICSDGFEKRGWSVLCGVFAGLAALTKVTAPGFVIVPALISLALPTRLAPKRQAINASLAGLVALLIALPWYTVNLDPTLDYLRSTSSGDLVIGLTSDPLTFDALRAMVAGTINVAIGTILVLVAVIAGALASRRCRNHRLRRQDLARIGVPASWFLIPFTAVAVSHNQDLRFIAPGVTAIAVLAAGAVVAIRPRIVGTVVFCTAAAALAIQYVSFLSAVPSAGSATVAVGPPSFRLTMPFDGSALGYARKPEKPDYATPIIRALDDDREAAGGALDVCLLDTHEVVNGNTLRYMAEAEAIPVTFTDLSYVPHLSDRDLRTTLSGCQAALYVLGDEAPGRVAVLNRSSAAARLTSADLATFDGPRERFRVGDGLAARLLRRAP